jgi:hypothetical protein
MYSDPERWVEEAVFDLAGHVDALADEEVFRPLCVQCMPYDVHFVDKVFGAEVLLPEGSYWWSNPLSIPVGSLEAPDLDSNETWLLAERMARAFVATGATVPLFGLPVIASVLNIGINLFGEAILAAMYNDPDAVRRDFAVINNTLCEMHRRIRSIVPEAQLQPVLPDGRVQPPGHGQICGCSTQLLSAEHYREFVAPLDDAVLSVYPNGGMIHLCGSHARHISVWRELKSFRAFQVNNRASEDLETYFAGLRDDQILYVDPCERMPTERVLQITGGRRLVLIGAGVCSAQYAYKP